MSTSVGKNKTAVIASLGREPFKQYYVYDGSSRLIQLYEAPLDTKDQGDALVTYFTYVGATTMLQGTLEFIGTWSSAYDISYP